MNFIWNGWQFNKLSKLLSISKNQNPPYLKTVLDTITNYHSHATRGHIISELPISKCKNIEFSKNYFFPSTIKLWNELHGTIQDSVNKSFFKKQYAPQNLRLHLEYFQAISHAQPKWPSPKSELVLVTLIMTFIIKVAQIPSHVSVATS